MFLSKNGGIYFFGGDTEFTAVENPCVRALSGIKKASGEISSLTFISLNYSCAGAPTGHVSAQVPQSMHLSASISYLPSPSLIASTGHSAAQAPHEMQSSEILYAILHDLLYYV